MGQDLKEYRSLTGSCNCISAVGPYKDIESSCVTLALTANSTIIQVSDY